MKQILVSFLLFFSLSSYSQTQPILKHFTRSELLSDFDLAVNSLKEAHPGLYWYTTYLQFDSICNVQRAKITDQQSALEFYRILAPVVSSTKEGHCKVSLSGEVDNSLERNGRYPPVFIKFINNVPYVINNIEGISTRGLILNAVNRMTTSDILKRLFSTMSSDGFNETKKYADLDGQDFAYYYLDAFDQTEYYLIELKDPHTNILKTFKVKAYDSKKMDQEWTAIKTELFNHGKSSSSLVIDGRNAVLTYNTFRAEKFGDFHKITDRYFKQIASSKVQNLILDLRGNGGGAEGYEDYVLSYLTSEPYKKYDYVQASALSYSFYKHTNINTLDKLASFENSLKEEHALNGDGRLLRKPGILEPEKPRKKAFSGRLYVLINGSTYSGGSEFASLIKIHRKAVFIGQETGGGFYGNTSGFSLTLTLPNSGLHVKVPLLKFVLNVPGLPNPIGRGLIPDYVPSEEFDDFLRGYDSEMNLAKKLIRATK